MALKFVYICNRFGKASDRTEEHIINGLERLGHTVDVYEESDMRIFKDLPHGDVLLFHKYDEADKIARFRGLKIFWYFDKIDFKDARLEWAKKILPVVDMGFTTDGDWAKTSPKLHVIRQGCAATTFFPEANYQYDVGFTGTIYGERLSEINAIREKHDVETFEGFHNDALNRLCGMVKIFIAPQYPSTENYWSNRVYLTMGNGGFILHPYKDELAKEYEEGHEIVMYKNKKDLLEKIDYYLSNNNERERIRRNGFNKTKRNYTYYHRINQICQIVQSII